MIYTIPYLFFLLFLFLLSIPTSCDMKYQRQVLQSNLVFVFIYFFIFIGFRGFISTDVSGYYPYFEKIPKLYEGGIDYLINQSNGWEIGFCFYTMIVKTIISDFFVYQASLCLIDLLILYAMFKRYCGSRYIVLCLFFFFIFQGFNIERNLFRNSKAIMLFILSIDQIERKNFICYLGLNLLGFLFHATALLFIPLYFILGKKYSKKIFALLSVVGLVIFTLRIPWSSSFLIAVSKLFSGRLNQLVQAYCLVSAKSYGFSIGFFERLLSLIVIFIYYDKLIIYKKENTIFINMFFIYEFLYMYCGDLYVIPQRVALLFIPSYWFLYPQIYKLINKRMKITFLFLFLIYAVIRIYQETRTPLFEYYNYIIGLGSVQDFSIYLKKMDLYNGGL